MPVDLKSWPRAAQFHFFRSYQRPHFAITTRIDMTHVMASRAQDGLSPFRTAIWAIGAGLHAVAALRMRFKDEQVTLFDRLQLSPTIAVENGDFRYAYLPWAADRTAFDASAAATIAAVRAGQPLNANDGTIADVAYLSCLPWLDYTALDNALPGADDCIPRVSWGRIVPKGSGHDMAMSIQVHHALVDGRQVGEFFAATQDALSTLKITCSAPPGDLT
jgi:chloramphenicol O-acetyltransferase type A